MFKVGDMVCRKINYFDHYWNYHFNKTKGEVKIHSIAEDGWLYIRDVHGDVCAVHPKNMKSIFDTKFDEHRKRLLNA